ncbi:limbic system-associated membrane protein-like [Dysidea avara]|uniref:limbic system-associated membrane protein-like n=1 Tax=Dysidea avara TaxID=196820 RepID=UPI003328F587
MEYCNVLWFTWCILALSATGKATDKIVIDFPSDIIAGKENSGSCTLTSGKDDSFAVTILPEKKCKKEVKHSDYRLNFTLRCEDGSYNAKIQCDASDHLEELEFKVIPKPKITTKPTNVTTMVGLPVTLSCHVKGDPDHYWVGWMYRDSIIQEGEQYATSTARSTRGTHHYLTIHSVKQSGNYVCKVYTIHGTVDETTNNVTVENDATKPTPTSLMDVVYKLLFS